MTGCRRIRSARRRRCRRPTAGTAHGSSRSLDRGAESEKERRLPARARVAGCERMRTRTGGKGGRRRSRGAVPRRGLVEGTTESVGRKEYTSWCAEGGRAAG
jgi:hypothetical protein